MFAEFPLTTWMKPGVVLAATAVALVTTPADSHAAWPDKPARVVVGYAPGGATDQLARVIANNLSEATGQPFVVENRPGANSNIAAEGVARAAPDGYTIFMGSVSTATNVSVYKNPGYNVEDDLIAAAPIAAVPNVLVVNAKLPIKSVADYIEFAKENPGKLTFASPGVGSSVHLSGELFKMNAKVDMLHVPYRGSGPAMTDLLGGQVNSMFDNLPSAMPHIQSGALRALGVTTSQRNQYLPDAPTIAEQGVPGYEAQAWFGMFVPAGTSEEIVSKLNQLVRQALEAPSTKAQLENMGATPLSMSPEEFRAYMNSEVAKWAEVIGTLDLKKN